MPGRKYTGNSDGLSRTGARLGLKKFVQLATAEYGLTNLGTFVNRSMNNPKAKKGDPKWLSVHATGRACDLGYKDRKRAMELWNLMLENSKLFQLEEAHDYAFDADKADKEAGWGRGYRCSRGEGEAGVKVYDKNDNAGSQGGRWLHFELAPAMADDPGKVAAVWKKIHGQA
jgi:hypothetical protein